MQRGAGPRAQHAPDFGPLVGTVQVQRGKPALRDEFKDLLNYGRLVGVVNPGKPAPEMMLDLQAA